MRQAFAASKTRDEEEEVSAPITPEKKENGERGERGGREHFDIVLFLFFSLQLLKVHSQI